MRRVLIILTLLVLLSGYSHALGVSPSKMDMFYEAGKTRDVSFRVINNEFKDMTISVVARGELADQVEIEEQIVFISQDEAEKVITYRLNMPEKLKPGEHALEIMVVESGADSQDKSIIVANIGIIHKLNVKVPYPDRYLEGIIHIGDALPGEQVQFTVLLSNAGDKAIEKAKGQILITGPNNEGVASFMTNEMQIGPKEKSKLTATWIPDVNPGTYKAQAIIQYDTGKVLTLEKEFDIGEPLVSIEDLSVASFKLGTIAKFDITVANKWNKDMPNVYGTTEVRDMSGAIISTYKTGSTDIPALAKRELNSYWDTKDVLPKEYMISVKVNYLGRVREKIYEMDVKDDGITFKTPSFTGEVSKEASTGLQTDSKLGIYVIAAIILLILIKLVFDFAVRMKSLPRSQKVVDAKEKVSVSIPMDSVKEYPELREYLRRKLKEGYSKKALRDTLMRKGWSQDIIDEEMLRVEDDEELRN